MLLPALEYNKSTKIMCLVITIKKMFIPNTFIFFNIQKIYYNCIHLIGCMHACDMLSVYVILCKYLQIVISCTDVMRRLFENKDIHKEKG